MSTAANDNSINVPPKFLRLLFRFGIATVIALLITGGVLGRTVVEKMATILIMPCGIIWYLLTICVMLVVATHRRTPTLAMLIAWLAYTICGSGHMACLVVGSIEAPFLEIDPLQQPPLDAIVVLGGGASVGVNKRYQGNSSGDRIILAAQLYHAGIAPKLICTGKRIVSMDGAGSDPADISVGVLTRLGVPLSAVETLGGQNTSEEMKNLSQRFKGTGDRLGLVTSAWHLQRALRLARDHDLEFAPLPADFLSGPTAPMTPAQWIMSCIPQADNFQMVSRVAKERLAAMMGR
jgi:uncharacterized SAM-binding protein YcdF (DUF218 family)